MRQLPARQASCTLACQANARLVGAFDQGQERRGSRQQETQEAASRGRPAAHLQLLHHVLIFRGICIHLHELKLTKLARVPLSPVNQATACPQQGQRRLTHASMERGTVPASRQLPACLFVCAVCVRKELCDTGSRRSA